MAVKNKDAVKEALSKLDHNDDSQWTTDGKVKMDVLQKLSGEDELTRTELKSIAPTFERNVPQGEAAEGDKPKADDKPKLEDEKRPTDEDTVGQEKEVAIKSPLNAAGGPAVSAVAEVRAEQHELTADPEGKDSEVGDTSQTHTPKLDAEGNVLQAAVEHVPTEELSGDKALASAQVSLDDDPDASRTPVREDAKGIPTPEDDAREQGEITQEDMSENAEPSKGPNEQALTSRDDRVRRDEDISRLTDEQSKLDAQIRDLEKRKAELVRESDLLIQARDNDPTRKSDFGQTVQDYLASVKGQSRARAEDNERVREVLGKDAPQKAATPLDAAMARKRGFGQNRPAPQKPTA